MDSYMMNQADKCFTWFYPVKTEYQLDFEGKPNPKDVLLEGHIVFGEALLCGEEMEVVKTRVKVNKAKKVAHRIVGVKACKRCEEAYKKHPMSAYNVWVRSLHETQAKEAAATV
jgi:hypothetical protein